MEKRKLLLVSVSTGTFLMLVLGAALLVFTPPSAPAQSASVAAVIPPGSPRGGAATLPDLAPPTPPASVAAAKPEESAKDPAPVVSIIAEPVETPVPTVKIETPVSAVVPKVRETPPPAPKPAVKPAPKLEGPAYWVQIGSYTQKSGADKIKENLSEHGLVSVIFNSDVQGKTFYRVRVGPYVSQAEANYWLKLVKAMDGFENSLIWKSGT